MEVRKILTVLLSERRQVTGQDEMGDSGMELRELPYLHRRPPSPLREQARRCRGSRGVLRLGPTRVLCGFVRGFFRLELDLSAEDITTLAVNSFEGSFLSDEEKAEHIAKVRAVAAGA